MEELTERQTEILDYIKSHLLDYHSIPNIHQTARHFDVYHNSINDHYKSLEKKGYIVKFHGKYRLPNSIKIIGR